MADSPSVLPGGDQGDPVFVECCRKCSMKYQFRLDDGGIITVLCGRPILQKYKAISYLWEATLDLPLKCQSCSVVTTIPMRDANKLWRLMKLARGGSTIWLDAMSINQNDPKDKADQLFVMGDIYRNAEIVSILLPASDSEAYQRLTELGKTADAIVRRSGAFGMPASRGPGGISSERIEILRDLADGYLKQMSGWIVNLHKWNYWRRAWTFQEWAMASEIEISLESASDKECLLNIKNVISNASTIIGHWRKTTAMQSVSGARGEKLREQVYLREEVGRDLNAVRAHFPFEDFLVADEAEDADVLRRSTFTPVMAVATDSGTYVSLRAFSNPSLKFRSLLSLALNAINTSKREARHDADLIACWASMCNIEYDYNRYDNFAVALHKVTTAIRLRGIKIYNFLANTDSGETDLNFLNYAAAHRQMNATSEGYLFGTPIFIGRADTVTHIKQLLSLERDVVRLDGHFDVSLTQVEKVIIKRPILWSDRAKAISAFRSVLSGKADGIKLFDVGEKVEKIVMEMSSQKLDKHLFVIVSITVVDVQKMQYFNTWAICPSNINVADLFVARESLNGTLVLAVYKGEFSIKPKIYAKEAQIVSYLNMTNQRDGTYLVNSDKDGIVDVIFRTEDTPKHENFGLPPLDLGALGGEFSLPDWSIVDAIEDREFDMQITLGSRELALFGIKDEAKTGPSGFL